VIRRSQISNMSQRAAAYPADRGRQVCWGFLQSMPSSI
jgi:hypothetical protein